MAACGPAHILTPRQREIAGWVCAGLRDREVAERLGLSRQTVKNHVQHIYDKVGVSRRVELVLWWVEQEKTCAAS